MTDEKQLMIDNITLALDEGQITVKEAVKALIKIIEGEEDE